MILDINNEEEKYLRKRLYKIYNNMKTRCYNPKHGSYKTYGAKGVTVCDRWLNGFKYFLEDVDQIDGWDKDKFLNKELQLDKDGKQEGVSKKVYSKDTCQFISPLENRRLIKDLVQFYVVDPEGNISFHTNVEAYCSERGLKSAHACAMIRGDKTRKAVKGYQFFDHYPLEEEIHKRKTYKATSPEGREVLFYTYGGLIEYGITESETRGRLKLGLKDKPTKNGWMIELIQEGYTLL